MRSGKNFLVLSFYNFVILRKRSTVSLSLICVKPSLLDFSEKPIARALKALVMRFVFRYECDNIGVVGYHFKCNPDENFPEGQISNPSFPKLNLKVSSVPLKVRYTY